MNFALDVEHTLIVLLTRLGLGEVTGSQRDRTNHPGGDQDVGGGEDLRTALQREEGGYYTVCYQCQREPLNRHPHFCTQNKTVPVQRF